MTPNPSPAQQAKANPNEAMVNKLSAHVIGRKIEGVSVTGHTVTIVMESHASLELVFEDVVDFAMHGPGRWVFVPTKNPGRPQKAKPSASEQKAL